MKIEFDETQEDLLFAAYEIAIEAMNIKGNKEFSETLSTEYKRLTGASLDEILDTMDNILSPYLDNIVTPKDMNL